VDQRGEREDRDNGGGCVVAWERPRTEVCIGIIHTGACSMAWAINFARLRHPPGTIYSLHRGSPFDVARNSIVDRFLDSGAKFLFFLDSDVLPPDNALERLMSHNLPIVSGLYYRRHIERPGKPPHPCMWKIVPPNVEMTCPTCAQKFRTKEGKYQPILNPPRNALVEVDAVGAGCLLIHRRVFEKLERPYFRWTLGWVEPGVSEDLYFCERARDAGFRILVDTGVRCGHLGEQVVDGEGRVVSPGV